MNDTLTEAQSGFYKGVYIEFLGGTWTPYRIAILGDDPRFFQNLNEAKAFVSWWLDDA